MLLGSGVRTIFPSLRTERAQAFVIFRWRILASTCDVKARFNESADFSLMYEVNCAGVFFPIRFCSVIAGLYVGLYKI